MHSPRAALAAGLLSLATLSSLAARPAHAQDVDIPFTKTTLPNGLVVILAEDHAVPQVAVHVAYAVGARVERPGRTGFAHLFEHLMFMGTRRAPEHEFDAWMEQAGGRNNAGTEADLTSYYDVAPPGALPLLLWLEADRMRDLGHEITQEKLDLQRQVVLNERRQSIENRPYGVEELELPVMLWPEGHPYRHPVIGAPADLEAAAVADVREFFDAWYDPANAAIAIAGDFDPRAARDLVERLFAGIPSRGKPAERPTPAASDARPAAARAPRRTVQDEVELAKVTVAWRSPPRFAPGDAEMDLLASVLANGKASRLYRALVYEQRLAESVEAAQQSQALGSAFVVSAVARSGVDPARVEKALLEQVARLRAGEVSAEELERARSEYEMAFVDRLQSIPDRASLLGVYQTFLGDPAYAQRDLDRYRKATPHDLQAFAARVLVPESAAVLTIVPRGAGHRP